MSLKISNKTRIKQKLLSPMKDNLENRTPPFHSMFGTYQIQINHLVYNVQRVQTWYWGSIEYKFVKKRRWMLFKKLSYTISFNASMYVKESVWTYNLFINDFSPLICWTKLYNQNVAVKRQIIFNESFIYWNISFLPDNI